MCRRDNSTCTGVAPGGGTLKMCRARSGLTRRDPINHEPPGVLACTQATGMTVFCVDVQEDASCAPSANNSTCLVIELTRRKRRQSPPLRPPRIVRLLEQAEDWFGRLASGNARTRSELAREEGVSAMRVTQVLALLKLHPAIRDAIRALARGTAERAVTERRLRPLTRLSYDQQIREIERLVPGLLVPKDKGVA